MTPALKRKVITGTGLLLAAVGIFYLGRSSGQASERRLRSEIAGRSAALPTQSSTETVTDGVDPEHYRRAVALANRETQRMRDLGVILPENAKVPDAPTIGDDGRVTRASLQNAGVDPEKCAEIQQKVDDLWKAMGEHVAKQARLDESKSDPGKGISVYRIEPFEAEGKQELEAFRQNLVSICGKDSAAILMSGLRPVQYFGNFGMHEVAITFTPGPPGYGNSDGTRVDYRSTDPETGRALGGGTSNVEYFQRRFGSSFKFGAN